jgi:alpha-tubulin suppressor-like RCC1 family protein
MNHGVAGNGGDYGTLACRRLTELAHPLSSILALGAVLAGTPAWAISGHGSVIAAGAYHTCALTSAGAAQCWGDNEFGQLGNGKNGTISRTPVAVSRLSSGVVAIAAGTPAWVNAGQGAYAAGASHTCALTSAGAMQCWGDNSYGQLGNGTTTNSSTPVAVSGLTAHGQ